MLKEILTAALAIVAAWLLIALLPSLFEVGIGLMLLAGLFWLASVISRHQCRFQALLSRGLIRQEVPIKTGASFLILKMQPDYKSRFWRRRFTCRLTFPKEPLFLVTVWLHFEAERALKYVN